MTEQEPYLYTNSAGAYNVFVPSLQTNSSGTTWTASTNTPGVYSYSSTIDVTKADTKIIGLGYPTLIPTAGNVTMNVADVNGVNISGMIFDAGPTSSS